jgi:ATP-dependent Clp endopeptidase proteolytic subunit ClpP
MDFTVNNNIISAYGTINDGDGIAFSNLFQQIESNKKDITVKLHTYGGSVFDGNLIYNTIANSIANVQIHIVGIAASMGAIISLASDKVYIVENGYIMIHAPSGGVYGTANDLESNIKLMRSMEQNFISKLLEKTGKNQDYVKKWLVGDNWFDANQALQEGLVTGIIEPETKINKNFNPSQLGTVAVYNRFSALLKNNTNINLNNDNMDLREQLIKKFRLKNNASDTSIFNALEQVEEKSSSLRDGLIKLLSLEDTVSDEDILKSVEALTQVEKDVQEERKVEANYLISDALRKGKIVHGQKEYITNMFKTNFAGAKAFLNNAPERISITSQIRNTSTRQEQANGTIPKSDWTIDEYRKFAPKDLANDPELYKRLINAKFNTK